jgi:aspartate/methionine/tyrosine aminotransferase
VIPRPSALERYFAAHEFSVELVAGASDVDGLPLAQLLDWADEDSRAAWARLTLGYTETAGAPALRTEIARLYRGVDPDDVVVCAGAAEALHLVQAALLGPGDHLVTVRPGFESLTEVAPALGATVTAVPLDPAAGWRLDVDAVRAAIGPRTRLVAVNTPHNPTGTTMDPATQAALVTLCAERGIVLLSDEVFRLLELDPAGRLPAAVELSDRAVSVGVLSKAYGLAGLRVGWIATRDRALRDRVLAAKDYASVCIAAPSEVLAVAALRAADRVVGRCRDLVAANLAAADDFLAAHAGVLSWTRPTAGTVGFPRLDPRWPVDRLAADLVAEQGVLILPGTVFGVPGHFRLGLGRASLPEALSRFDTFLRTRAA